MHNADRYPNGVPKLGVLHRDSDWIDRNHRVWRWDDWHGWQMCLNDGTQEGSFQTVEGSGPFLAVVCPEDTP